MCDVLHKAFNLPEIVRNKVFESDTFVSKSGQVVLTFKVFCSIGLAFILDSHDFLKNS